jgi:hypothetical protein
MPNTRSRRLPALDGSQQEGALLSQHLARDDEPLNSAGETMVPP